MTYLLAIDQGTTNSRAILFDRQGTVLAQHDIALQQSYPKLAWVEQDPEEIFTNSLMCCRKVLEKAKITAKQVAALGIANQRETTIVWHKTTGIAVCPAIVWQDRRTASLCEEIAALPIHEQFSEKTGLILDPYFSLTKLLWILEHVPHARSLAEQGELLFGTVDCYLLWRFTNGKSHATDASNAARTLMFNIKTQSWDEDILTAFNIPRNMLPIVLDNVAEFGVVDKTYLGHEVPITGMAGDQQAAAIGQACFAPGMIKATFGTGSFILLNTGTQFIASKQRLLTTILYRINNQVTYGLEGSIFSSGTTIKWLRDRLQLFKSSDETAKLARLAIENQGVYFVPAFTGLGAPYWRPEVKAAILGITSDTGPAQIVRAALESVAYQTLDLIIAMLQDQHFSPLLRVDGGMAANPWLLQFMADILQMTIQKPRCIETTALGAAYLAGLGVGIYSSLDDIAKQWQQDHAYQPSMNVVERDRLYAGWQSAVQKVLG